MVTFLAAQFKRGPDGPDPVPVISCIDLMGGNWEDAFLKVTPGAEQQVNVLLDALISASSPPRNEDSSTTLTLAEQPDPQAVHVCVVAYTADSPQQSIRALAMDLSHSDANLAPIAAIPSRPRCYM